MSSYDCIDHGKAGNSRGHRPFSIVRHGKRTTVNYHRLVYCEANGITLDSIAGLVVRHKCDNARCINPEHLEIGTVQDNINDRVRRGRSNNPKGADSHRAKLTAEQVATIRATHIARHPLFSARALAEDYGVSPSVISMIITGKQYEL